MHFSSEMFTMKPFGFRRTSRRWQGQACSIRKLRNDDIVIAVHLRRDNEDRTEPYTVTINRNGYEYLKSKFEPES